MSPWLRKRDGSIVYVMRDGIGGWIEVPPQYWPDPPRVAESPKPDRAEPTSDLATPCAVLQFMREIGRRGGRERCRNFARRTVRGWIGFKKRYGCDPCEVNAAPVRASPEVRPCLREFASRGGRSRAHKYPREQLRAWAAKGGHAKAAKLREPSSPQHRM